MTKRVKREQFPCKQYQNPSQYYKMFVVKIVWTAAAAAAYLLKNSLLIHPPKIISNPAHF